MARKQYLASLASFLFVLLSKVGDGTSHPLDSNPEWDVDFNTLLDSDLGATPAVWITSQGIVVELKARKDRDDGLRQLSQDADGAEAGFYLASLLVPPSKPTSITLGHKNDNSALARDICGSLVNLPKGRGNPMIDLETLQNRVLKSIIGNGFTAESTRNLCKILVPGIEAAWEDNQCPWYDARLKIAMGSGFQKVLAAHLTDLGTDETPALRFASELEATLRLVDNASTLEAAFEHLVRELMTNISTLVLRGSATPAVPSLKEFTKLSDNAARRLPQGPIPVGTSHLQDVDDPICIIGIFTELALSSLRIAADLGGRMEVAADSATSLMGHLHAATLVCRSRFLEGTASDGVKLQDEAITGLRNVAGAMRELVDKLPAVDLPRSNNWPSTGIPNAQQAHPQTISGNFALQTAIASSDHLAPSPTATTLVRHARPNFTNSIDPHQTPSMQPSLSHNSEVHPAVGYVFTLGALTTVYYRVPDKVVDTTAYHAVPEHTALATSAAMTTIVFTRNVLGPRQPITLM